MPAIFSHLFREGQREVAEGVEGHRDLGALRTLHGFPTHLIGPILCIIELDIRLLLDTVEVFMQPIQEEGHQFLGVLLLYIIANLEIPRHCETIVARPYSVDELGLIVMHDYEDEYLVFEESVPSDKLFPGFSRHQRVIKVINKEEAVTTVTSVPPDDSVKLVSCALFWPAQDSLLVSTINMGPKRRGAASSCSSPAQKSAKAIAKKYRGKKMTPEKAANVRRVLYSVCNEKLSLRKAAREYGVSYGFLYRRYSGEVDIEKIKGPETVFSSAEEKSMAEWLSEMAQRGMGLRVCEFLDFVQDIVKKENRQTPFKDGRPSYQWFTAFKHRNGNIIDRRTETPLELKWSKLSKSVIDEWYSKYRNFLISIDCLDKPSRIWNADESGFNMGSASAKVIGPTRRDLAVPHITAGKQRLTVMYCGRATGEMMPPFFVFPEPKPRSYNPLNGSLEGSAIAYTKKGWMDSKTFDKFIDHFDKYAGQERPVVLLIDSVGSHVDHTVFMHAKAKGIEIYRIVPNATHLMQPLDKGVFGPLKGKWNLVSRRYSRENPGKTIGKENFAEKLNVAYLEFYKPLTVINAFK
ncbi:JERKL-like protein [Mya arenaria]|uniref:JERKL-like protein n=1 Tax=Mya arenaria TaxID=6604 RepID=A0ABY7FSP3_MYAAR|nr:JERKL-like protein [Mya arenaria]